MENTVLINETGLGQGNRSPVASDGFELARVGCFAEPSVARWWDSQSSELGSRTSPAIGMAALHALPVQRCGIATSTQLGGDLRADRSNTLAPAAPTAETLKYAALFSELGARDANGQTSSRTEDTASATGAPNTAIGRGNAVARNEAAIQLIRSWIAQDLASGEDEHSWAELQQELDRDRASSRRLFP